MEYKVSQVALDDINPEDHTFRITTRRDKPSLLNSIPQVGLLQPPAVWRNAAGLVVVSGFRRIRACRQLGIHTVPARRIADDQQPLDCLRMAVFENTSQRPLNLVEMARAICRVKRCCPPGRKITDELVLLGLPASRKMVHKLDQLIRLGPDLQHAVVDGWVSLNTALEIGTLERMDQSAVHAIFACLRMSVSKQKEILALTRDIAGRDRKSIHDVLQSDRMRAIVDDDQFDRNQKTAMIRRHLKKVRYPHLTQTETQYNEAVKALKLGPRMRIDPPAHFEGTTYTLSLRFESRDDLEAAYQTIGVALQNPAIQAILPK